MAKKKLRSGLELTGISPNILLKQVESTAPFLFNGEIDTSGENRAYLKKLVFYKKNLKLIKHIDLCEYFYICLAAHWSTAGTFVPTDVDNQIREGLWKHKQIKSNIDKMAQLTIQSWSWDVSQVTNRKSYNRINDDVLSTHEGTWLSVAIGAYCALVKNKKISLANDMQDIILKEIKKEEQLLLQLQNDQDHINFLRAAPLMAHNFGDLDRVMTQWKMDTNDSFYQKIFNLGHKLNNDFSPILVFTGSVNKKFSSKENHRHMSMRQAKCLRKSHHFLIPVGPFMDHWGTILGQSNLISAEEKAEIIATFYDGYLRQDQAFGYCRAYKGLMDSLSSIEKNEIENFLPYDLLININKSKFKTISNVSITEFQNQYIEELNLFICPKTKMKFKSLLDSNKQN